MAEAINFPKMRKELILLYENFLEKPEDQATNKKIMAYELLYGGLSSYNEILSSQPVPKDIGGALEGLSTIYQYGMWEDTHEAFSNEKIVRHAKKILGELKKN